MGLTLGAFYRFKPRITWPPTLQHSIPEDRLYFLHPVIIVATLNPTTIDVVTITSSPNLSGNSKNYLRISNNSSEGDGVVSSAPVIVNTKLPKESWAVLDSKRRFDLAILEPWTDGKTQFHLGKRSRIKLARHVDERMTRVAKPALTAPPQPKPASIPAPTASPQPKPAGIPASTATAKSKSTPQATATSAELSPKSAKSLDIQDIKKSLAGLKVAMSALEGLCEKLEARDAATAALAPVQAAAPSLPPPPPPPPPPPIVISSGDDVPAATKGSLDVELDGTERGEGRGEERKRGVGEMDGSAEVAGESAEGSAGLRVKKPRLRKWLSRVFRKDSTEGFDR